MPISRSQLRLVCFDAHAPQRRQRGHARRRPASHEGLRAPARNGRCDRRARSRAAARATNAGSPPRARSSAARPTRAPGPPAATRSARRDRGRPSSGCPSASRSCSAAPSRRLVSSNGGGVDHGRDARRARDPAGRELGQRDGVRDRQRLAAACARDGRPGPSGRPTWRGAAADDRQQEIRHEATHATARQPSGVRPAQAPQRHRPHRAVLDLDRLGDRFLAQADDRPDRRSPASAPRPRAARAEPAPRRERETARSVRSGNTTRVALGGAQALDQQRGRHRRAQPRPHRDQHVGRGQLEQRPERNPLEHVARAHQHAALERRHRVAGAAPTRAARSRGAAATAPGSTGSAPPPSAPSTGRRPPGAAASARSGRHWRRGRRPAARLGRADAHDVLDRRQHRQRRHLGHAAAAKTGAGDRRESCRGTIRGGSDGGSRPRRRRCRSRARRRRAPGVRVSRAVHARRAAARRGTARTTSARRERAGRRRPRTARPPRAAAAVAGAGRAARCR